MYDIETLLSQFADDTDLFLTYEQITFDEVLATLKSIEMNMGLKVNYDKTSVYRIGSIANSNARLYTATELNWTNEPINILGVFIANDMKNVNELNFNKIFEKINAILKCWKNRNLTLSGRVLVVNSLVASLSVYKMSVLGNVPYTLIEKFETIVSNFIWKGKRPKNPLKLLQLPREQGGLRLVHLFKKQLALKAQWVKLIQSDPLWAAVAYNNIDVVIQDHIWKCNLSVNDLDQVFETPFFWSQVLYAWCEYNFNPNPSAAEFRNDCIWYRAWTAGLRVIAQLFNPQGAIKKYQEVVNEFGDIFSWFEYCQLITAIPSQWKKWMTYTYNIPPVIKTKFERLFSYAKISGTIYSSLIDDRNMILKKKVKWESRLHMDIDNDFSVIFLEIFVLLLFLLSLEIFNTGCCITLLLQTKS